MKKQLVCILALVVMLGANFASVLPSFAFTVEGEQMEMEEGDWYDDYDVSTWQEMANLLGTVSSSFARLNFTGDIVKEVSDSALEIPEDMYVVLNLNGYTLSLLTNGMRGLQNYGDLTITGNGTINNGTDFSGAYGLIDNYGSLVVENGTFVDYGQGNGSSIKNRPSGYSYLAIESGTFIGNGIETGNACVYSDGILYVNDGVSFMNASNRAYALIVNSGIAMIGETVGNIENSVVVDGTHGGLGINGGEIVVNNGVYTAKNFYGIWITNNNNSTDVEIKYAEAHGNRYGVYSSVDDGRQDLSDVGIAIADGKYSGGTKAAVAVNSKNSEHSFGMAISGGEFSTKPDDSYLVEGHVAGLTSNEEYPYMVVDETDNTDQYDVEYEENEDGEDTPVIYPAQVDWADEGSDGIATGEDAGVAGKLVFDDGQDFIADRKAYLSVEINDGKAIVLDETEQSGSIVKVFDISVKDRDGGEVEVSGKQFTVRILLSEDEYQELVNYDELYMVYVDDDGVEQERIKVELRADADNHEYWLVFEGTHLSTYALTGITYPREAEEAAAPETGTVTAAGASAMSAALVTAMAVGVLTAIASFSYLVRRKN